MDAEFETPMELVQTGGEGAWANTSRTIDQKDERNLVSHTFMALSAAACLGVLLCPPPERKLHESRGADCLVSYGAPK